MVWAGTKQNGKSISYQMPGSEETAKREKVEYLEKKWSCPFQSNIKKKLLRLHELTYSMQSFDDSFIIFPTTFDHSCQWIWKPLFKIEVRLEYIWHQEMHKGPQFH